MHRYLKDLNLFPSINSTDDDEHSLRSQRISTRAFLVLFLLSLWILVVYNATTTSMHRFVEMAPTYQKYGELDERYPQVLACPCSQISNRRQSFITIDYSRHPICSSVYATEEWIIGQWLSTEVLYLADFRRFGTQMFLALASLCQLADASIKSSLEQFYSGSYLSAAVTSVELFQSELEGSIEQFIASTTNYFLLTLRMIGNTTQANGLLSTLMTNFIIEWQAIHPYVHTSWVVYDDQCSCSSFSKCTSAAAMYANFSLSLAWIVPGFYRGCYILEALRRSDLRCFFNQTCLAEFRAHLEFMQSVPLPMLTLSSSNTFKADTLLGTVIDRLFVDQWHWTINHSQYYNMCKPKQCTYTVLGRNDALGIVTATLALIGGLVKIERLIIPKVVGIVMRYVRKRQDKNVHPSNRTVSSLSLSNSIDTIKL